MSLINLVQTILSSSMNYYHIEKTSGISEILKNSKLAFGNKILYKTRNRFSKILIKRLKMKLTKIMNKNAVVLAIQFAKMAIQQYIVFSQTIGQRGN